MWILSTLGSLALTAYRAAPAVKSISKAITTPKKTSSGGSFVSKTKPTSTNNDEYSKLMKSITPTLESLDDNTPMTIWWDYVEARKWVTTGIWFWEGQTVDSIMKGYDVPAYRTPEKENPLYRKAIDEVKAIENNSSYDVKRAKELDSSWTDWFTGVSRIFSNTKNIDWKSISEIKIARDKAVRDVVDFKNPNSTLHKTFKNNIEQQGYNYEKDFSQYVSDVKSTTEPIKWNVGWMKDYVNEERWFRGLRTLPIINAAVDKISWGEYNKYLDAIDQAKAEWDTWIIEDWTTPTANLLGWALLYWGIGKAVNIGTVGMLNEWGFAIGWRVGWAMVTSANRIRAIEQASPTLYAIAVDNPLTTVVDYWVTKSLGWKYSGEDVAQALITGTALPIVLKWATSSLWGIWKWLTTKSLNEIDSQVSKLTKDGAMTNNDAIIKVASEYEIEPWKTIMDAMEEANVSPRNTISPEETRASFSQRWVSTSSISSKKISTVLNNLNKKINDAMGKEDSIGGGYWELWESWKAIQAKAAIVSKLDEAKIVDGKTADEIIKEWLESNGLKYTASKWDVPIREWEVLDDALHNPRFSGSKLKDAEDMDTVGEAINGSERTTPRLQEIASARADVSVWTKDAETQVRTVASKAGIDIDERKLLTKVDDGEGWTTFVLNKKYAEDVLYRAEVRSSWYAPARSTALARTKRLISEGTTTLRKGMNNFSRTLKLGSLEWKRMVEKNGDELYNSSSYSHLPTSTRRRIIDTALKSNDGSISSLEKRIAIADEKLHIATFNKLEKDVDDMIKDIKNKSKSRTKKNTIDIGKEEEMILAYNDFAEAKLNGDLVWMKNVYDNLRLFAKEGRSIYKEDLAIRKESTRISTNNVLTEMELQWIDEFEARIVNTPSSGTAGQRKWLASSVGQFFEDMLPTHEQFVRYFGKDSVITQKMYKVFSSAESNTQLVSHKLMWNWQSTFKAIKKWITGDDDSLIQQYTLWRNSKSTFNTKQWVLSGHDYNMKNDMIGYYDKNWNPQIITVRDGDKFRLKNSDKIKSWEYIDFWSKTANEVQKEDFLNKMYKRFDSLYDSSKDFKNWEDYFRNHFDANGKKNASVMRRVYNKKMDIVDMYNPIYIHGKSHSDLNLWEVGDLMGESFRETIDASHTLSRIWPWQDVRMVLDFATLLERHVNGSVHWWNMIEHLNEAEAMLRMMKKWKSFIRNAWDADDVIAKEMWFGSKDWADPYATMMGKWDVFTSNAQAKWERLMTPEVDRFLSENLRKFATRSGSISGAWVQLTQNKTLGQFMWRAYKTMLTWWTTGAKQVLSDIDISTLAGAKNWATSTRSIWLHGNFSFLLDESGHLLDRQAERFSGAHGKKIKIMWARWVDEKIFDALDVPADLILGNVIKWVDGWMSWKALLGWISKVLDERYPNLHTAWGDLNLRSIKEKLTKVSYVDWVRVIDDSEWKSVLADGELFMHQVMGSNSMIDDALGSKWPLGKMVQFMGKAATNRVIAHWDSIVHNSMKRQLAWRVVDGDSANKARTLAYWITGSAVATAYSEWLKSMNNSYDVWSWKTSEADAAKKTNPVMEILNKQDADSFIAFWNAWFESQFFQPQTTLDVLKGYEWVSNAIKDYGKQESTEWKIRAGWAILSSIVPVHGRVTDAFKKWVNDLTWFDMRRSGLNDSQKSWANVKKAYGDKFDELTQSQKDELIAQQNKINEYNQKNSKTPDVKEEFLKSISKRKLSEEEFMQELAKNPQVRSSLKNDKELKALYNSHTTSTAKTSWERDSLLMGKPLKTVYDLEIVPMAESWDFKWAFERIKEMRRKWIIKSDKGAIQMMDSLKELHSRKSK